MEHPYSDAAASADAGPSDPCAAYSGTTVMTDFKQGGLYFMLWYGDENFMYLAPDAVVFIGKNLDPTEDRDEEAWYFQDARSYCEQPMSSSSPLLTASDETLRASNGLPVSTYVRLRSDELSQITDLEGLSNEIKNCQTRRRAAGLIP